MAAKKRIRQVGSPDKIPAKYRPGAVWIRKKDNKSFVLTLKDDNGLRFKGFTGAFSEEMFRPK